MNRVMQRSELQAVSVDCGQKRERRQQKDEQRTRKQPYNERAIPLVDKHDKGDTKHRLQSNRPTLKQKHHYRRGTRIKMVKKSCELQVVSIHYGVKPQTCSTRRQQVFNGNRRTGLQIGTKQPHNNQIAQITAGTNKHNRRVPVPIMPSTWHQQSLDHASSDRMSAQNDQWKL